ncbi:MAG: hypothetical protein A2W29_13505 [Gemmatimonadetes bacterium RBG_16_66_8]|nr:MAG: hypothetical protein A2W29_13505 [Gemmatimonadetes bacterium RBG_16_66_8]
MFEVQPEPVLALTAISPPAGPPGAPVVLSGQGFAPLPVQNTLLFNGLIAGVTSASATSLVSNVPLDAVSGDVTVQVGAATSNPLRFEVLPANPTPGTVVGQLPLAEGVNNIAITSDGGRAYVTNPSRNTVSVIDVRSLHLTTRVTVGLGPRAVDLTPDNRQAYVCNEGSDNVSVIDTDSSSATFHKVVATVLVGHAPQDLEMTGIGPEVLVVNGGNDSTISIIDANPGNATFRRVTTTVNTGSQGRVIAISPDGGRAFVSTRDGKLVVIGISSRAVLTTVNTGSSGRSIAISPDGGLLVVLLDNGTIKVIDIAPGSPSQYKVLATVNAGSNGRVVAISPDGGLVYVTFADGNTVLVYDLVRSNGAAGTSFVPGPAVSLTVVATLQVGQGPDGIAIDPSRGEFALVANSGDGTVTLIGSAATLPPLAVEIALDPNTLHLKSVERWVTCYLEPPTPFTPQQLLVNSILMNGRLPVDPAAPVVIDDHDQDGVAELAVGFDRAAMSLILPEGMDVPVSVTGLLGPLRFAAFGSVRVKRAKVIAPAAGALIPPAGPYTVLWEIPGGVTAKYAQILYSFDRGGSWRIATTQTPNKGAYTWAVPDTAADSARVAILLVESADSTGDVVQGVLGISDYFRIGSTTAVEGLPGELALAPLRPNPAHGELALRYALPAKMEARLEVFDIAGRRVRTLASGVQAPGWHEAKWNGRSDGGDPVGAGIYFVRLKASGRVFRQHLVWLR